MYMYLNGTRSSSAVEGELMSQRWQYIEYVNIKESPYMYVTLSSLAFIKQCCQMSCQTYWINYICTKVS